MLTKVETGTGPIWIEPDRVEFVATGEIGHSTIGFSSGQLVAVKVSPEVLAQQVTQEQGRAVLFLNEAEANALAGTGEGEQEGVTL